MDKMSNEFKNISNLGVISMGFKWWNRVFIQVHKQTRVKDIIKLYFTSGLYCGINRNVLAMALMFFWSRKYYSAPLFFYFSIKQRKISHNLKCFRLLWQETKRSYRGLIYGRLSRIIWCFQTWATFHMWELVILTTYSRRGIWNEGKTRSTVGWISSVSST